MTNPGVAAVSCEECQQWMRNSDWSWTIRGGQRVKRPKNTPLPCKQCPKIPKSAPQKIPQYAVEVSKLTRDIYEHWLECLAVGKFPDDPLVRRHARLLQAVKEEVDREDQDLLYKLLANATIRGS